MKKEEILKQFKLENSKLIDLNPLIRVTEKIEEWSSKNNKTIIYDPPLIEIEISRPFIFDVRLIPETYNGFKVNDLMVGDYPEEFPSENAALPLEDFYAPEFYIKFVDNYLDLISEKIKIPNLTRDEALDALTGDFGKHINWCIKMRTNRIKDEKESIAFFNELLYEVRQAYLLSDVYKNYKDKEWYYSITSTRFSKNKPLIVGFNWGVDNNWIKKGNKYSPQCQYPFTNFEGLYDDLGSFKRVIPFFHNYFPAALSGTQTNFCFFRSEIDKQITKSDIELCKPIFEKLISYLNPSCIISFSRNNLFLSQKNIEIETIGIPSGNKTLFVSKGKININKSHIDFYNLPHPESRFKNEAREKAWNYCFGNDNAL